MSKNTNIAGLANYISIDGSGNVVLTGGLIMSGSSQAATQTYVNTAISNLVNSAPAALDTLAELSTALNNDASFATTITNSIATKLPLSGGTLTGALSGTSATFSSSVFTGSGIGVGISSLSAWNTVLPMIEGLSGTSVGYYNNSGIPILYLNANAYFNGSAWIYKISGKYATTISVGAFDNTSAGGLAIKFSWSTSAPSYVLVKAKRLAIP